jgi:hypothetical protein
MFSGISRVILRITSQSRSSQIFFRTNIWLVRLRHKLLSGHRQQAYLSDASHRGSGRIDPFKVGSPVELSAAELPLSEARPAGFEPAFYLLRFTCKLEKKTKSRRADSNR